MTEPDAFASFHAKWRQHQPEMELVEPFCRSAERPLLNAWGTLLNELFDTTFTASDPAVLRTTLGWWGEDLAAGAGAARHPVALALLAAPAATTIPAGHWRALAGAATALGMAVHASEAGIEPRDESLALAGQLAALESELFGQPSTSDAVVVALGVERLRRRPPADGLASVAANLQAHAGGTASLGLFRGSQLAFDRWRLARLAHGAASAQIQRLPPWSALWLAWRAARRSWM